MTDPIFLPENPPPYDDVGGLEEAERLRRMVERRDEFIIANGLWDAFKEASREEG